MPDRQMAEEHVAFRLEVGAPFGRHRVGGGQVLDEELFDEAEIGIFELAWIHLSLSIAPPPSAAPPSAGAPGEP